jgi:site-specific recombinase XerD
MKTEIELFLATLDRAPKTISAYRNALSQFIKVVGDDADLTIETYTKFLSSLKRKAASTQTVYTTAVLKFYAFQKAGNPAELQEATEHHTRKQGNRIVNFNREAIDQIISHCAAVSEITPVASTPEKLRANLEALRDRAFILTLTDTGLRISEACALKRGDIDWLEQRAIIIDKGDRQAVIRFSNRATEALQIYLHARAHVEPNSRKPLGSQPLFARHDIRASKTIRPITAGGMWKAIKERMEEAGLERNTVRIHDFCHYFVTMTYLAKRDLKLSQILARHEAFLQQIVMLILAAKLMLLMMKYSIRGKSRRFWEKSQSYPLHCFVCPYDLIILL